ncbi:MAG: MlaD family protein [Tropicimonas sp.]|uniref:MlaD family protein n=1 Tax=Tropicimonas sp. TaxID=2067044 RepID=UPI003A8C5817
MTDQIPQAPVHPPRRKLQQRFSMIWFVPGIALAVALGIAWNSYNARGALIEIRFPNASGIVADKTELRYREVSVGKVEEVTFSDDLSQVIVHVRVDKSVEEYIDADSVFWVVQPKITTRGITGLETVLSGIYIEGSWDGVPGGLVRHFDGLPERPVARPDQDGVRVVLTSMTGRGLTEDTPVLYKGIEVGTIGKPALSPDGVRIIADAFIKAPYDDLLTTESRFWDTSGISFNLGTSGASIDVESLATLISGGISFETVVSGGDPVERDREFNVFDSQNEARDNLFDQSGADGGTLEISMVFSQNVSGLAVGAPVVLDGLQIGEVVGITGRVDPVQFGDDDVRLIVILSVHLNKLDAAPDSDDSEDETAAVISYFEKAVADGWRARLARTGMLSTKLQIEIARVPDAPPAEFEADGDPYPIFPSVESDLKSRFASSEGMMDRLSKLPIEDLMASAKRLLDNAARLVASEDIQKLPGDIRGTVGSIQSMVEDARGVISSPELQELPGRLTRIADEIASVLEEIDLREGGAKLVDAIEKVGATADEIASVAEGVPELLDSIKAVADNAASLDLSGLVAQAQSLVDSADKVLDSDSARALPASLKEALDEVAAALGELRAGGAVESVNAAFLSVENAAGSVEKAAADLPDLVRRAEAVLADAEAALATLSDSGELNREVKAMLRDVSRSAESVRSLMRLLERKPNALLTGR